jgi:L-alanine-DL-glutamate epimerase-like enolase superfamily enzyme
VGEDVEIMVDFNRAFGSGDTTRKCCDLDDQGLYWFEEPILYNDFIGYWEIAKRVSTPIQMGENFYGEHDLMNSVCAGATHYVMADLKQGNCLQMRCGARDIAITLRIQFCMQPSNITVDIRLVYLKRADGSNDPGNRFFELLRTLGRGHK